jgi:hypothetical protein
MSTATVLIPDVEQGAANANAKLNTTAGSNLATITATKVVCIVFMGIIVSSIILAFIAFVSWGPYLIWRYSHDALTIAITNSVWLEISIVSLLNSVVSTSIENQTKTPDIYRKLNSLSLWTSVGLLTPAIIYSWLNYATPQASYNALTGKLLMAYGIIELIILIIAFIVGFISAIAE